MFSFVIFKQICCETLRPDSEQSFSKSDEKCKLQKIASCEIVVASNSFVRKTRKMFENYTAHTRKIIVKR